jgi:hypothetical protein
VLLFLHEGSSGRDRIGRTYYLQAMDMWRRLGLDGYKSRPYDCEESDPARQNWRATTVAVWGIFCVEKFTLPVAVCSCLPGSLTYPSQFYVLSDRL